VFGCGLAASVRFVAALGLLTATLGCSSEPPHRSPIRVGYASGITTSSLWIADRAGYFAAQGVEIVWHRMDRPSTALPQLVADRFDVMSLHVTAPLFGLIARGERIRIVADRGHHAAGACAAAAVVTRRDLDPGALPRRVRAGVAPTRWQAYMLDRLRASLAGGGIEWELLDVPMEAESVALAGGSLDVGVMSEPILTRSLEQGTVRLWRGLGDLYPDAQQGILVFGPRLLDRERDLGARFLTGYLRAERELARGKTDENVARLAAALEFDPALVRRICWLPVRSDLGVNFESLADFQGWALDQGLLERIVPPGEYWDGTFAAAAIERLSRVTN
jgi:NitT/TauT family transport system substrate-binding protein